MRSRICPPAMSEQAKRQRRYSNTFQNIHNYTVSTCHAGAIPTWIIVSNQIQKSEVTIDDEPGELKVYNNRNNSIYFLSSDSDY